MPPSSSCTCTHACLPSHRWRGKGKERERKLDPLAVHSAGWISLSIEGGITMVQQGRRREERVSSGYKELVLQGQCQGKDGKYALSSPKSFFEKVGSCQQSVCNHFEKVSSLPSPLHRTEHISYDESFQLSYEAFITHAAAQTRYSGFNKIE